MDGGTAGTTGSQSPAIGFNAGTVTIVYGGRPFAYSLKKAWVPLAPDVTSPARLLRARAAEVPYLDPAGHLDVLRGWLAGPESFSVRLVGGRGGSGKTRLAVELCRAVPGEDWASGFLGLRPPESIPNEQVAAGSETGPGMLVVIDYAETRISELERLLPALQIAAGPARPIRVLLLVRRAPSRGTDWTSVLRTREEDLNAILDIAAPHEVVLEEAAWDLEAREDLYRLSWEAFAERSEYPGGTSPSAPPSPPDLAAASFGNPLLVAATAYLAVHDPELTMPDTREGLLEGILGYEAAHWTRSAERPEDRDGILTRRVTAMAALAGADNETEGAGLLHHVPDLEETDTRIRRAWARWYQGFYGGPRFWIPLEPDLLGEHLIATTLAEFPSALAASVDPARGPNVAQPLIVIARIAATSQTAEAYPGFNAAAATALQGNLTRLTRSAVDQAATPQTGFPAGPTIASALAQAVNALSRHLGDISHALATLPRTSVPRVNALVVALTRHDVAWLRSRTALTASGSPEEALTGTPEAVKIRPNPVEAASLTYSPDLATALHQYSIALTALGSREDALNSITEAVKIRRDLVKENPHTYLPTLASALREQAIALTELGRKEAVATIDEAVQIRLKLAEASPDADLSDLANALNEKSIALARSGDHKDALNYMFTVEQIFRRLAEARPDAYLSDLAKALNNKSNRLVKVGDRLEEALSAITEAVEIRRGQAAVNPDTYLPNLATALNNQSNRLAEAGKYEEALPPIVESLRIRDDLARDHPDAFRKDLATARNNLSRRLGDLGRDEEALSEITEAVRIRRDLARDQPDAFRKDLATALNNQSIRLATLGQRHEAFTTINESIEIRRPMAEAQPKAFLPNLATALNNQSSALAALGRHRESLAAATDATEIRYALAKDDPDAFRPALASALNNKSNSLAAVGLHEDALTTINKSLNIRRALAEHRREAFLGDLSTALNNASNRLAHQGRHSEALAAANEAVTIRRMLAEKLPDAFLLKLATALNNQSNSLARLDRYEEALAAIVEAMKILRDLVEVRPPAARPYLATALNTQSNALACLGRQEEALTAINESVQIFQELAELFPDAFLPNLATAQTNQSLRLEDLTIRKVPDKAEDW